MRQFHDAHITVLICPGQSCASRSHIRAIESCLLAEPRLKAVVGSNAFAHEAGIHQDGILKNPLTYEIISPEEVGVPKRQLVLGKHSGRNALRTALVEIGYTPTPEELDECYKRVSALADESKNVQTRDLLAIARRVIPRRGTETAIAAE